MVNHRLHGELIKIYFFYKNCFNQIHEHIKDIIMNPHESVLHTWKNEILCKVDCVLLIF